jgi:uncharacterized protein YigE (DUF2233 family)
MHRAILASIALISIFIAGCIQDDLAYKSQEPTILTNRSETATATVAPTPTIMPDSGWEQLRIGLERRVINLLSDDGALFESLYLLRIDPEFFRFDVGYSHGEPLSLEEWQNQTGALIVLNGGFFDENNEATGMVTSDGQRYGRSYAGFGGMFSVNGTGPDIRWLQEQPYDDDEVLIAAVQSFPILVLPGGQLPPGNDSNDVARRTVIGQDQDGRLITMVSGFGRFSLAELARYLVSSDLNLDRALNLDGGASTGMLLADPAEGVIAFSLLPTVILVYEK